LGITPVCARSKLFAVLSCLVDAGSPANYWNVADGIGCRLSWCLDSRGSAIVAAPGSWQTFVPGTTDCIATASQQTLFSTASQNFFITMAQLEQGSQETQYEWLSSEQQVQQVERYFWKTANTFFTQLSGASTQMFHNICSVPSMRGSNTVVYIHNPSTLAQNSVRNHTSLPSATNQTVTWSATDMLSATSVRVQMTSSATSLFGDNCSATVTVDAELYNRAETTP